MEQAVTAPTAHQIGIWIMCALIFVNVALKVWPRSARRSVTVEDGAATRQELAKLAAENREEHQLLHKRVSETADASEERSREMVRDYNEKFQQLPFQIVAHLRNTGVIRDRDARM